MNKKIAIGVVSVIILIICAILLYIVAVGSKRNSYDEYNTDTPTTISLDDHYDKSITGESTSGHTGNVYADAMIDNLMKENGYSSLEILQEYQSKIFNTYTYIIVFDNDTSTCCTVAVDEYNQAYYKALNYDDYMGVGTR